MNFLSEPVHPPKKMVMEQVAETSTLLQQRTRPLVPTNEVGEVSAVYEPTDKKKAGKKPPRGQEKGQRTTRTKPE